MDLYDFCRRSYTIKVNRRVLEALIKAGAMDELGAGRSSLIASLNSVLQLAEQHQKDEQASQNDMFGTAEIADDQEPIHMVMVADLDDALRLSYEKETLGLYLTGHPIERYEKELKQFTDCRLGKLADQSDLASGAGGGGYMSQKNARSYKLAGLMVGMRVRRTKTGGKIVSAVLDDRTARVEVRIYEEKFDQYNYLLNKDKLIVVEGKVVYDDYFGGYRITADVIYDITEARQKFARRLEIDLKQINADHTIVHQLNEVLNPFREGNVPVWINYQRDGIAAKLSLGEDWCVQPSDELLSRLDKLTGENSVTVIY